MASGPTFFVSGRKIGAVITKIILISSTEPGETVLCILPPTLGEKSMRKVNVKDVAEEAWDSPKGKFEGAKKEISVALGRNPLSTDLNERHPFDVEICRIPPGKSHCPYHSHSAQWEFYHVISGKGVVRHAYGTTSIEAGDAFI